MRPERGHHGLRMKLRILGEQLEDDLGSSLRCLVSLEVDDQFEVQAEALPDEIFQPGHPGRRELVLEHMLLGNVQLAHLVESHFGYPSIPGEERSVHHSDFSVALLYSKAAGSFPVANEPVGQPVDGVVMEHDSMALRGERDVELDAPGAVPGAQSQRLEAVLGRVQSGGPVGDAAHVVP